MRGERRHHDLPAWQLGIEPVKRIYSLTAHFPQTETYGLAAQMRRAAVSIPSNIAEGAARESSKEFAQSLIIARGSLRELETQLRIADELGYIQPQAELDTLTERLFSLIGGLLKTQRDPGHAG